MYKLLQEQYNYTTIDHGSNCKSKQGPAGGEIRRPNLGTSCLHWSQLAPPSPSVGEETTGR